MFLAKRRSKGGQGGEESLCFIKTFKAYGNVFQKLVYLQ